MHVLARACASEGACPGCGVVSRRVHSTLYWVTGSITSSMRDYLDNRRWHGEPRLGHGDLVRVPTAVAVFPHMLLPEGEPPQDWAERCTTSAAAP